MLYPVVNETSKKKKKKKFKAESKDISFDFLSFKLGTYLLIRKLAMFRVPGNHENFGAVLNFFFGDLVENVPWDGRR